VLIGDVVGLGKTITATALLKIFEDDFLLETLIICPKNLEEMWQDYIHHYRLRATTMSFAKAQNQLKKTRRYRLVLIDESHNLRNRQGKRYKAIQEYIKLNDSRVIMLTATPYNKSYDDLANQLRLFLDEDQNLGIKPENYIESVGGGVKFQANHQVRETSIAAFEKSNYSDDWSELMRLFLVRRTRSFIKENYAKYDSERDQKYLEFPNGERSYFPERIPKKVEYAFDPSDPDDQYAQLYSQEVVDIINNLQLARYGIGQERYQRKDVNKHLTDTETKIWENLSRAGLRLIGFARTNLFKRLESSGFSFLVSISKHILRNYVFIYAIENNLHFPIGSQPADIVERVITGDSDMEDEDQELNILTSEEEYRELAERHYNGLLNEHKKYQWIRAELFNHENLAQDLLEDSQSLLKVLKKGKSWKQEEDRQLNALHKLITEEHKDQKILVFTQFSDTANYLYESLRKRGLQKIDCVTGDSESPTRSANHFSPSSNGKDIDAYHQTQVLISTDVLSEGQNLQDSHIVLNYDLPWALIRLIQRAGRVDRIGQKHHQILCYSFLPEDGIENIINLRGRLKHRISENAETVGSDEVFFEGDPVNIQDLYNEKAGILDEDEDLEIDLASYAYQIWKNATDQEPSLEKTIPQLPNVVYATKQGSKNQQINGSIAYTKTSLGNDMLAWVDANKEIVTQSQMEILRAIQCGPDEPALERFSEHHELVRTGLEYVKETESRTGGQLGKKNSARYRVYERMKAFISKNPSDLLIPEGLDKAIQDIYDNPLREYAREILNRHLKSGIQDDELAKLLVSLREQNSLSLVLDEGQDSKAPKIICSMGLKIT
jgi:superfamily II DNA or RNA helicase